MSEEPKVKDNVPAKHVGLMPRIQWRTLFMRVQMTSSESKAELARLLAAAEELEDVAAMISKPGGRFNTRPGLDIDEVVSLEITDRALRGIKLAVVRFLKPDNVKASPALIERMDLLAACAGFGTKFRKMIEVEAKLADAEDEQDEEPLNLSEEEKKA